MIRTTALFLRQHNVPSKRLCKSIKSKYQHFSTSPGHPQLRKAQTRTLEGTSLPEPKHEVQALGRNKEAEFHVPKGAQSTKIRNEVPRPLVRSGRVWTNGEDPFWKWRALSATADKPAHHALSLQTRRELAEAHCDVNIVGEGSGRPQKALVDSVSLPEKQTEIVGKVAGLGNPTKGDAFKSKLQTERVESNINVYPDVAAHGTTISKSKTQDSKAPGALSLAATSGASLSKKEIGRKHWLSILRSLLRECSYLPDPNARIFAKKSVLRRFRGIRPLTGQFEGLNDLVEFDRAEQYLASAQKTMKLLHEANSGYFKPLVQILLQTYGRIGRRRYELLAQINKPQPSYVDKIGRVLSDYDIPLTVSKKIPHFSPIMDALIKSQRVEKPKLLSAGINPRTLAPEPMPLNAWKETYSPERIRNELKDWYAKTMGRLLPPLPTHEWETLRKRAVGEIPYIAVKRRAKTGSDHLGSPFLLESLKIVEDFEPKPKKDRAHALTARFMRKLWERVFMMCPLMKWNEHLSQWDFSWGMIKSERFGTGFALNSRLHDEFSQPNAENLDRMKRSLPSKVFDSSPNN